MSQENNKGQGNNEEKDVSIHIDKQNLKSPNPTSGAALYVLGSIDATQFDLFKEAHGKDDDELIPNTSASIVLNNGDKFYTAQKNLNPGA